MVASFVDQSEDWRTRVPPRFQDLPDQITVAEIAKVFGYTPVYVRQLRQARVLADSQGDTNPLVNAFPRALGVFRRPLYWNTREIIEWGIQTGRLDPTTGEVRRLPSPGRRPRAART